MNYWITTDTHFGHVDRMVELAGRDPGYETKAMRAIFSITKPGDVLIHLGDVAIHEEAIWHRRMLRNLGGVKSWMIRGNHDRRSDSWYLNKGWDFVGESIRLNRFGKTILLTHKPQPAHDCDLNIHGHLHARPGRFPEENEKTIRLFVDRGEYLFNLRNVVEGKYPKVPLLTA